VPAARVWGFARALTRHALAVASGADALHMLAAVDSRNEPARRLYRALGFSLVETRTVYLYYFAPTAEMRTQQEREEGDFKAAGD
jgi:ribosomal protein S18 acetylase RimI-like enzyme